MERIYKLKDFEEYMRSSSGYTSFNGDYLCMRIKPGDAAFRLGGTPYRYGGLAIHLIIHGHVIGEYDNHPFDLSDGSIMSFTSSNVVKLQQVDWDAFETYFIIFSPQFLQDLNIDLNAINLHAMMDRPPLTVCCNISDRAVNVIKQYIELLLANGRDNSEMAFAKNIARSLTQALIYQLLQYRNDNTTSNLATDGERTQTRQMNYVQEFIRLLSIHYATQRNVSFYADSLCISTKYLSHIIKETTGMSAADWIGEFVAQQAKNMLRFSNKNVQQVAYELNFPSQSSFGKYFKNITGLSPTEFKKT